MESTTKITSASRTIDDNHKKFTADPDYVSGLKALDHHKLRAATNGLQEKISTLVNYYVFFRNMKSIKITKGVLSEDAEKALVARGREALNVFQDVSSSINSIAALASASGYSKAVDRHIESLCQHLNYNPKVLAMLHEIKDMGITEAEIACVSEDLKTLNYNLLRYGGADGTFSDFAKVVVSLRAPFEKEHTLMEQFGVPTLQGAGGSTSGTTTAVVVTIVVIAAVLCIFFYF
jgi:hypothetical protein